MVARSEVLTAITAKYLNTSYLYFPLDMLIYLQYIIDAFFLYFFMLPSI